LEKLKNTIEKYSGWQLYSEDIERIEGYQNINFAICVDSCKCLLEGISKSICELKSQPINSHENMSKLLSLAFGSLGYPDSDCTKQVGKAISSIGQQIGNLRNEIGRLGHGRSLQELNNREDIINSITRDFLLSAIESLCCFLIETFELDNPIVQPIPEIRYEDVPEFNDYWDEAYGEFNMGLNASFMASEILFKCEFDSYKIALNEFKQNEINN